MYSSLVGFWKTYFRKSSENKLSGEDQIVTKVHNIFEAPKIISDKNQMLARKQLETIIELKSATEDNRYDMRNETRGISYGRGPKIWTEEHAHEYFFSTYLLLSRFC